MSWAIGAVDCAVWDLHGRLADVPVASLITAKPAPEVSAYASWLRLDVGDPRNADAITRTAREGWVFTKWGLRSDACIDPAEETARLVCAARRAAAVAGARIALDALGTWDTELTLGFADQIDPSLVLWLEDPLPGTPLDGYRQISPSGAPLELDSDTTTPVRILTLDDVTVLRLTDSAARTPAECWSGTLHVPHGQRPHAIPPDLAAAARVSRCDLTALDTAELRYALTFLDEATTDSIRRARIDAIIAALPTIGTAP